MITKKQDIFKRIMANHVIAADRANDKIAFDGKTWKDIEEDHL